ncbi:hypothetical protein HK102_000779 [Quaeritorhiza haematococci]|nr:hypothetical protein HK102_000779 [Quaeritorhiza haematococci]
MVTAITDKTTFETLQSNNLNSVIESISELYHSQSSQSEDASPSGQNDLSTPLVPANENKRYRNKVLLIHGAGSFGHHTAKEYRLVEGFDASAPETSVSVEKGGVKHTVDYEETAVWKRLGMAKTRSSVAKLQHMVCEALIERGVPAIGVTPGSFIRQHRDGSVSTYAPHAPAPTLTEQHTQTPSFLDKMFGSINDRGLNYNPLIHHVDTLLTEGYLPVLHGDVLTDPVRNSRIVSGDDILRSLAFAFNPERCVFVTDVEGVYTGDPKKFAEGRDVVKRQERPVLLRRVLVDVGKGALVGIPFREEGEGPKSTHTDVVSMSYSDTEGQGAGVDVTGGMKNKIGAACRVAVGALSKAGSDVHVVGVGTQSMQCAIKGQPFETGTTISAQI